MVEGNQFPDWVKILALPLAGALVTQAVSKYRRRLVSLRWSVNYQRFAFATEDIGWGKIDILWNNTPIRNLHMAYVQVQNASSRDVSNLRLSLIADPGTVVLRSGGILRGGSEPFAFSTEYQVALKSFQEQTLPADAVARWSRESQFVVPVLNRNAFAEFALLIARDDYQTPSVAVSGNHVGVNLVHQPPTLEIMGVRQNQAVLAGLVLGLGVALLLNSFGLTSLWGLLAAWAVGATGQVLGASMVRLWRGILALAD